MSDKALEIVEIARNTGKIKKGANEITKALERGKALFVVVANDVNPPEITMHIPILAKEKGIACIVAGSREDLGAAAGIARPTVGVAVVDAGEAKAMIKGFKSEAADSE